MTASTNGKIRWLTESARYRLHFIGRLGFAHAFADALNALGPIGVAE